MDRRFADLFGRSATQMAEPLTSLQRELSRIVDEFGRGFGGLAQMSTAISPRIDVKETAEALEVHAELPGVDEADIDLQLSADGLTIRGEKKAEQTGNDAGWHVVERSYGSFLRQIPLPFQPDPARVEASFAKGVLKVVLPKPESSQPSAPKIKIKSA